MAIAHIRRGLGIRNRARHNEAPAGWHRHAVRRVAGGRRARFHPAVPSVNAGTSVHGTFSIIIQGERMSDRPPDRRATHRAREEPARFGHVPSARKHRLHAARPTRTVSILGERRMRLPVGPDAAPLLETMSLVASSWKSSWPNERPQRLGPHVASSGRSGCSGYSFRDGR